MMYRTKFAEAAQCCRQALALNPRLVDAHSNLGNLMKAQGLIQEALRIQPTFAIAWSNLVGLFMETGDLNRALLYYKAELQKVVGDNGPTDGKDSNEKKNIDKKNHHSILLKLIADLACCEVDEICDFELQVCDTQPSIVGGALKEFIFSGRLDNLCMSFCSLKALIDSTSPESSLDDESGVRMVALFDHEEVGSNSAQGAGSPAMLDALSRITTSFTSSDSKLLEKAIQRSFLVTADMAHALHPNYMDKHEENHQPKLHSGLVIKHNANHKRHHRIYISRDC